MIKTIWNILRAFITAPDAIHWIKKYDAAKAEIKTLKLRIEELERRP